MKNRVIRVAFAVLGAAVLAACGGGGDDGDAAPAAAASARARPEAPRLAAAAASVTHDTVATQFFNFAETHYGEYFPATQPTQNEGAIYYRHYPSTGAYLGIALGVIPGDGLVENGVYVMGGPFGGLRQVGLLAQFLTPVNAPFATVQATVTPAGGSIATPGAEVALTFGSGALETATAITIAPSPRTGVFGAAADVTPAVAQLWTYSTVSMKYASLPAGWADTALGLSRLDGEVWSPLSSSANVDARTLSAEIDRISTLAIRLKAPEAVSTPWSIHWPFSYAGWTVTEGCWKSNDAQYDWRIAQLAQALFKATGCVTHPYMADGYQQFKPALASHAGIDFRAEPGTPVYAITGGSVEKASLDTANGVSELVIRSVIAGGTYRIAYQHCQSHDALTVGKAVQAGDKVCEAGSVGAPSSHLHLEVKRMGMDQNQLGVMTAGTTDYLKANTFDPAMLIVPTLTKGYVAFLTGDPKVPGDTAQVPSSLDWYRDNQLTAPVALTGLSAGFTVGLWAKGGTPASIQLSFSSRFPIWDPCHSTIAGGMSNTGTRKVNGVTGVYVTFSAAALKSFLASAMKPEGCGRSLTVDDFDLTTILDAGMKPIDAAWLAPGTTLP